MVHLLPMNWTDYKPGRERAGMGVHQRRHGRTVPQRPVTGRARVRPQDHDRRRAVPGDDRVHRMTTAFTDGAAAQAATEPERHVRQAAPDLERAVRARQTGRRRHQGRPRGRPRRGRHGRRARHASRSRRTRVIKADGHSLSYVTVNVVDKDGVMVPVRKQAHFDVSGAGKLVGLDNGQNESAESYHGPSRSAYHGMALAIVRSDGSQGPIRITATSPGLLPRPRRPTPTTPTPATSGPTW